MKMYICSISLEQTFENFVIKNKVKEKNNINNWYNHEISAIKWGNKSINPNIQI